MRSILNSPYLYHTSVAILILSHLSCATMESHRTQPDNRTIGGVVLNTKNEPITGATVNVLQYYQYPSILSESSKSSITTDSNGRWHCQTPPRFPDHIVVIIDHPDYPTTVCDDSPQFRRALAAQTAELLLEEGHEIGFRLVDTKGAPLPDATLTVCLPILNFTKSICRPIRAEKNDGGTYIGRIQLEGSYRVCVRMAGYRVLWTEAVLVARDTPITFTLVPFERLRGRIAGTEGHPLQGVEIEIDDPSWDDLDNSQELIVTDDAIQCAQFRSRFSFKQTTGPDGRFGWIELEKTRYKLIVTCAGFEPRSFFIETGEACQTIVLKRKAATGH